MAPDRVTTHMEPKYKINDVQPDFQFDVKGTKISQLCQVDGKIYKIAEIDYNENGNFNFRYRGMIFYW